MNLKKSLITTLTLTTLASSGFIPLHTVNADSSEPAKDEVTLSNNEELRIINELKELNVNDEDIESLIIKLESGIPWDSFTDVEPISEETTVSSDNESVRTIYRYEDGSVYINETTGGEKETVDNNEIRPYSVTGGNTTSGSGYTLTKGATVTGSNVLVTMKFKADYERWSGGGGKINRVYDYNINVQPGTYSNPHFVRVNNRNRYLKADVAVQGGGMSVTRTAKLSIIMNSSGRVSSSFSW